MKLEITILDAFTDTLFKGNSAAVIIIDDWLPDQLMQAIGAENNLSETAFVVPTEEGDYLIRWFSPLSEIDFCGHASLAAASVLFEQQPQRLALTFYAAAVGRFEITKKANGQLQMDFPNTEPEPVAQIPSALLQGLSIAPHEVYRNQQAYFVLYRSEAEVRAVQRDNAQLKKLAPLDVVVTCQAESAEFDFISRYFWPANGGDEDPVTGSIHTGLAPFWAKRLGKNTLRAYQASARGGVLECEVRGERVLICGHAVRYLTGSISV